MDNNDPITTGYDDLALIQRPLTTPSTFISNSDNGQTERTASGHAEILESRKDQDQE